MTLGTKKWNRAWKLNLIEQVNPDWRDLAEVLGFEPMAQAGTQRVTCKPFLHARNLP